MVKLDSSARCSQLLGYPVGVVAPNAPRISYVFDNAPASIKEVYCVLETSEALNSVPTSDPNAQRIVDQLCASDQVLSAARDCSVNGLRRSAADPTSFSAPEGSIGTADGMDSQSAAGSGPAPGTVGEGDRGIRTLQTRALGGAHGCDVCASYANGTLFVTLPPEFQATVPTDTMAVRLTGQTTADITIVPPVNAQTFTVNGIGADVGAPVSVTIYPPNTPPSVH